MRLLKHSCVLLMVLIVLGGCASAPVIESTAGHMPPRPYYRILVRNLNPSDPARKTEIESIFERAIHAGSVAFARTEAGSALPLGFDGILNVFLSDESSAYRFELIDAKSHKSAWQGKAPKGYKAGKVDLDDLADELVSQLTVHGLLRSKQPARPLFGSGEGTGSGQESRDVSED